MHYILCRSILVWFFFLSILSLYSYISYVFNISFNPCPAGSKVISLSYHYIVRLAHRHKCSLTWLYICWQSNSKTSLKLIMDSSENGRWTSPFKKFIRVRVRRVCFHVDVCVTWQKGIVKKLEMDLFITLICFALSADFKKIMWNYWLVIQESWLGGPTTEI